MDKQSKINYIFYSLMEIRYADPVSGLAINNNLAVLGTMLGKISALYLPDKRLFHISDIQNENITGISFESANTNMFNISVGDEETIKYELRLNDNSPQLIPYSRSYNFEYEDHCKNNCESNFTLISDDSVMIVKLILPEEKSKETNAVTEMKNLLTNEALNFEIEMTNYSVPFDFNGERYTWVEYYSESSRAVCVLDYSTKVKWSLKIDNQFGHISHMKLISNNRIFIIRNLSTCEIRETNDVFNTLSHCKLDCEIIACDVYYQKEKDQENLPKKDDYIDLRINKQNVIVVLLDLDGNVYQWNTMELTKLFNLFEMKDINKEYKEKQFFSMNYPYYIKSNENYIAISSDHGVFIFRNSKYN